MTARKTSQKCGSINYIHSLWSVVLWVSRSEFGGRMRGIDQDAGVEEYIALSDSAAIVVRKRYSR